MRMLMVHFYSSVIGNEQGKVTTGTALNAMQRWKIPVHNPTPDGERCVRYVEASDELLARARAAYEAERTVRAVRSTSKRSSNGASHGEQNETLARLDHRNAVILELVEAMSVSLEQVGQKVDALLVPKPKRTLPTKRTRARKA